MRQQTQKTKKSKQQMRTRKVMLVGTKDTTTQHELLQRKEAENTCRRSSLNKATMKGQDLSGANLR
jgi:uncharacterized protein YjbI with pentapeptide repeats